MALIDHAMDHMPEDSDAPLDVLISDFAHRVREFVRATGEADRRRELRQAVSSMRQVDW